MESIHNFHFWHNKPPLTLSPGIYIQRADKEKVWN